MGQEEGIVYRTTQNGWAQVITKRKDACSDCGAHHCCQSFHSQSNMITNALNRAGAETGDRVTITLKPLTVTKSAAILYLIPMVGLISGAVLGAQLGQSWNFNETTASILLAFGGLFLGFIITGIISKWMSAKNQLTPIITRIIQPGMQVPGSFRAIDPVCKMAVDPFETPINYTYQNKTYNFCNTVCRESFIRDPERYL